MEVRKKASGGGRGFQPPLPPPPKWHYEPSLSNCRNGLHLCLNPLRFCKQQQMTHSTPCPNMSICFPLKAPPTSQIGLVCLDQSFTKFPLFFPEQIDHIALFKFLLHLPWHNTKRKC